MFLVRIPNFLAIDPVPFDADNYSEERDNSQEGEEQARQIHLKVENTLRWRYVKDENDNIVRMQVLFNKD
jgi:RNA polymerase-associated protein LEO1